MKSFMMAFSAVALIFAASACNPNRNNPNYNASQTQQPGAMSSPGTSERSGNTGSLSGSGDTSNTGSSSSTGTSSENR